MSRTTKRLNIVENTRCRDETKHASLTTYVETFLVQLRTDQSIPDVTFYSRIRCTDCQIPVLRISDNKYITFRCSLWLKVKRIQAF